MPAETEENIQNIKHLQNTDQQPTFRQVNESARWKCRELYFHHYTYRVGLRGRGNGSLTFMTEQNYTFFPQIYEAFR